MSKNKREFDRHPGTGGSIKPDSKRSGSGTGNWGDDKAVIGDAVTAHKEATEKPAATAETTNPPPKDDLTSPENLGDLTNTEEKPKDVSYEEYVKQQSRTIKAYDTRTVTNSNFRPDRYKGKNQAEKATDELLQGAQKEKKKRKKTRKQQKIIKPEYSFHPASGMPDRASGGAPRGRGRGRGRGGGEGGFGSNRPYGGGAGGDRGGYSRGYGGFGSRGRGRRNDENVEDMPHQRPPPQYRLKNEGQDATTAAPSHNNENVSIPQPIV